MREQLLPQISALHVDVLCLDLVPLHLVLVTEWASHEVAGLIVHIIVFLFASLFLLSDDGHLQVCLLCGDISTVPHSGRIIAHLALENLQLLEIVR